MSALVPPTADVARDAAARIADVARRTPLVRCTIGTRAADVRLPAELHCKLETSQPIGSFKIRGAANAMRLVPANALRDGVWTASAGNMAQGVAYVARELGVPCRVVVPEHAPATKLRAIAALGATTVTVPFEAWWQAMLTRAHPGMTGLMIHPFADAAVMAGNGTIALELAEELPAVDAVLVPWGGGGLSLGIAGALRGLRPGARVFAVEVETAAPLTASLAAGRPVTVQRTPTWIDGMGSDRVSADMWPMVGGLIAGTVVVTVAQVAQGLRILADAGIVAEGAGAASVAAALGGRVHDARGRAVGRDVFEGARVACIISGANIDADVHAAIVRGEEP